MPVSLREFFPAPDLTLAVFGNKTAWRQDLSRLRANSVNFAALKFHTKTSKAAGLLQIAAILSPTMPIALRRAVFYNGLQPIPFPDLRMSSDLVSIFPQLLGHISSVFLSILGTTDGDDVFDTPESVVTWLNADPTRRTKLADLTQAMRIVDQSGLSAEEVRKLVDQNPNQPFEPNAALAALFGLASPFVLPTRIVFNSADNATAGQTFYAAGNLAIVPTLVNPAVGTGPAAPSASAARLFVSGDKVQDPATIGALRWSTLISVVPDGSNAAAALNILMGSSFATNELNLTTALVQVSDVFDSFIEAKFIAKGDFAPLPNEAIDDTFTRVAEKVVLAAHQQRNKKRKRVVDGDRPTIDVSGSTAETTDITAAAGRLDIPVEVLTASQDLYHEFKDLAEITPEVFTKHSLVIYQLTECWAKLGVSLPKRLREAGTFGNTMIAFRILLQKRLKAAYIRQKIPYSVAPAEKILFLWMKGMSSSNFLAVPLFAFADRGRESPTSFEHLLMTLPRSVNLSTIRLFLANPTSMPEADRVLTRWAAFVQDGGIVDFSGTIARTKENLFTAVGSNREYRIEDYFIMLVFALYCYGVDNVNALVESDTRLPLEDYVLLTSNSSFASWFAMVTARARAGTELFHSEPSSVSNDHQRQLEELAQTVRDLQNRQSYDSGRGAARGSRIDVDHRQRDRGGDRGGDRHGGRHSNDHSDIIRGPSTIREWTQGDVFPTISPPTTEPQSHSDLSRSLGDALRRYYKQDELGELPCEEYWFKRSCKRRACKFNHSYRPHDVVFPPEAWKNYIITARARFRKTAGVRFDDGNNRKRGRRDGP